MKIPGLSTWDFGGRNRTRTCDPIDVNDVLYHSGFLIWRMKSWPHTGLCLRGRHRDEERFFALVRVPPFLSPGVNPSAFREELK